MWGARTGVRPPTADVRMGWDLDACVGSAGVPTGVHGCHPLVFVTKGGLSDGWPVVAPVGRGTLIECALGGGPGVVQPQEALGWLAIPPGPGPPVGRRGNPPVVVPVGLIGTTPVMRSLVGRWGNPPVTASPVGRDALSEWALRVDPADREVDARRGPSPRTC